MLDEHGMRRPPISRMRRERRQSYMGDDEGCRQEAHSLLRDEAHVFGEHILAGAAIALTRDP